LRGVDLPPFEELRPDLIKGRAEVVISCLPERIGAPLIADFVRDGVRSHRCFRRLSPEGPRRVSYDLRRGPSGADPAQGSGLRPERVSIAANCARLAWWRIRDVNPTGSLLGILPLIKRDLIDIRRRS